MIYKNGTLIMQKTLINADKKYIWKLSVCLSFFHTIVLLDLLEPNEDDADNIDLPG